MAELEAVEQHPMSDRRLSNMIDGLLEQRDRELRASPGFKALEKAAERGGLDGAVNEFLRQAHQLVSAAMLIIGERGLSTRSLPSMRRDLFRAHVLLDAFRATEERKEAAGAAIRARSRLMDYLRGKRETRADFT